MNVWSLIGIRSGLGQIMCLFIGLCNFGCTSTTHDPEFSYSNSMIGSTDKFNGVWVGSKLVQRGAIVEVLISILDEKAFLEYQIDRRYVRGYSGDFLVQARLVPIDVQGKRAFYRVEEVLTKDLPAYILDLLPTGGITLVIPEMGRDLKVLEINKDREIRYDVAKPNYYNDWRNRTLEDGVPKNQEVAPEAELYKRLYQDYLGFKTRSRNCRAEHTVSFLSDSYRAETFGPIRTGATDFLFFNPQVNSRLVVNFIGGSGVHLNPGRNYPNASASSPAVDRGWRIRFSTVPHAGSLTREKKEIRLKFFVFAGDWEAFHTPSKSQKCNIERYKKYWTTNR